MILRDYQLQVINDVNNLFDNGERSALIVLPCGAGKTKTFISLAENLQLKGKTVWFLVPRQELYNQTVKAFEEVGVQCKTIEIGMVLTYANRLHSLREPDYIVFDEAHLSITKSYMTIADHYPNAKIIGLTATPVRLSGEPLGKLYDNMVTAITAKELIERDFLADYDYYTIPLVDLKTVKSTQREYDLESVYESLSTPAIYGNIVEQFKSIVGERRAIVYCSTVKHSIAVAEQLRNNGINAISFDATTSKKIRTQIINDYRDGKIQVLVNVDIISIGFDVPECEAVVLLRPTKSLALYIQQAMRCLRYLDGKRAIILDMVGNVFNHNFPTADHEWTLDGKIKVKQFTDYGDYKIRQCPKCYFTYETQPICPCCGYVWEVTRKELEVKQDIKMEKLKQRELDIKKKMRTVADMAVDNYTHISQCRHSKEVFAYCRKNGFSNGYAFNYCKSRKWL